MNHDAAIRDLAHADPRVRAQAADALGRDEPHRNQAIAALEKALEDAHPSVRYAALLSLGELAASSSWKPVVAALDDEEPLCREAAAIALGELGAPECWQPLVESLDSEHGEVRFQAVASLAQIDAARAAPLVRPLVEDHDAKVRAQAAAALGDARDLESLEPLAQLLDDEPEVRHEAALALAQLGDARAVAPLVDALGRRDQALDAASALARLDAARDAEVAALLEKLLGRWLADPLVKVRAAEALARAGHGRGHEHLRKALHARRDDVRGLAESILRELHVD
jgi:HEAT repeat protein